MYDTMLHVYDEPMRLSELALNGTDLVTLGYEGERIGVTLEVLMDLVREHPEYNTRESLLKVLPPHKT
jgi:tRNA nucleotidyltransferase (CCA-adding enzyme)